MDLHLTTTPTERPPYVRMFLDGALICEVAAGVATARDTLALEVEAARGLQALAHHVRRWQHRLLAAPAGPDHVDKAPAARQRAFAEGLEAGLTGARVPFGRLGVPPLPPAHTPSYRQGYEHGAALQQALALIPETPCPTEGSV
jgi:hypothetical protein